MMKLVMALLLDFGWRDYFEASVCSHSFQTQQVWE